VDNSRLHQQIVESVSLVPQELKLDDLLMQEKVPSESRKTNKKLNDHDHFLQKNKNKNKSKRKRKMIQLAQKIFVTKLIEP
jgi:hypothetical protein